MSDILTERSENILSIQLNRPEKKNATTSSMLDESVCHLQDRSFQVSPRRCGASAGGNGVASDQEWGLPIHTRLLDPR